MALPDDVMAVRSTKLFIGIFYLSPFLCFFFGFFLKPFSLKPFSPSRLTPTGKNIHIRFFLTSDNGVSVKTYIYMEKEDPHTSEVSRQVEEENSYGKVISTLWESSFYIVPLIKVLLPQHPSITMSLFYNITNRFKMCSIVCCYHGNHGNTTPW